MLTREGGSVHFPADESLIDMTECTTPATIQSTARAPKRQRSRGQSMVEFALVLPLLLGFLLIAGDFGRALTAYMTVSSAASQGAVFASRSSENSKDAKEINDRVREEVGNDGIMWETPVVIDPPMIDKDFQGYDRVAITVSYNFEPLFKVWPIPPSIDMTRTVQMRVLGN